MLESPTNPRMQICDLRAIADLAHAAGAIVCVDNSIMCPVFQLPLDLGADISMTSATKFVGGHSDVTAGILAVRDPELADRIYFVQASERERESGGGVLWRGVVRGVWRAAGKGRCGRGGARGQSRSKIS